MKAISRLLSKLPLLLAVIVSTASAQPSWPTVDALPAQPKLPDPLVMMDGRKVTSPEMWCKERRPELIRLFQHYMYGDLPPAPAEFKVTLEREDKQALGGKANLREFALQVGPKDMPPVYFMVVVPNSRPGKVPVVLALNYHGNHTLLNDPKIRLNPYWMTPWSKHLENERSTEASRGTWTDIWRIADIIDRGYAVATCYYGDIDPDRSDDRGIQKYMFPPGHKNPCGSIAAWAWGLQRCVDALITMPDIDPARIITTGHSRTGKAALLAAAFDERIAMTIPHQAGCGGTAPSRAEIALHAPFNTLDGPGRKPPESVVKINEKFPHWFNAAYKTFNDHPERLPFDQNALIALCAPRPVLFSNGRTDTWINPAGQFEVMKATASVYRLLGAGDFTATELPYDGEIIGGALSYVIRPGGHTLLSADWKAFLDFADQQLGRTGVITIDPEFPHSFRCGNGERFFPMGDTAYYLLAQPKEVIAHFIETRRAHHFNFIRMMAAAEGAWPFGGSPSKPDYTTINETVMQKLDWVFDHASAQGMNIELILFGYGISGGEGLWSDPVHQQLWIDTLVRRYGRRSNLFMFTIANEFERYPDGKYRFDAADVEWAKGVASRIRKWDKLHPIGCHPSVWITDQDSDKPGSRPFASYGGFTQRRPQVVWPLWKDGDVNLNITQNNEGVQTRFWGSIEGGKRGLTYYPTQWQGINYPVRWTDTGWDFEAAGLEDCIADEWTAGRPVLNTEFGYQHEPGDTSAHGYVTRQVHQPATVRKKAWKIATAGGYFAAGFRDITVNRSFTIQDVDNFRPASLQVLYDFFTRRTEYWKMSPHLEGVASHNVLLALPGIEYVAYFPRGGTNSVQLTAGKYRVEWLHPATGEYITRPDITTEAANHEFTPPRDINDDWVLHLKR